MAFETVLGDNTPMPITLTDGGAPVVLDAQTDTFELNYRGPDGVDRTVVPTIADAALGKLTVTWQAGNLPVVGPYRGKVKMSRTGDATYPHTHPDDGTRLIWFVNPAR